MAPLGLGKEGIRISGFTGHGGLANLWEQIKKNMDELLLQQDEQRFILFNAGLHDVNQLCSQEHGIENKAKLVGPLFGGNAGAYSCQNISTQLSRRAQGDANNHSWMAQVRQFSHGVACFNRATRFQVTRNGGSL